MEDLTERRFGRLVVKRFSHSENGKRMWNCVCDCGKTKIASTNQLKNIYSCGCLHKEATSKAKTIHGMSKTPTYRSWQHMKDRCQNPKEKNYHNYGGRGIRVCERWRSFANFLEDMGLCPDGFEIERIDNDGNYEPGNCKWDNHYNQARNRRTNVKFSYKNKEMCLKDICELEQISYKAVHHRMVHGWNFMDSIHIPSKSGNNQYNNLNQRFLDLVPQRNER